MPCATVPRSSDRKSAVFACTPTMILGHGSGQMGDLHGQTATQNLENTRTNLQDAVPVRFRRSGQHYEYLIDDSTTSISAMDKVQCNFIAIPYLSVLVLKTV